jgi:hypothetical protein
VFLQILNRAFDEGSMWMTCLISESNCSTSPRKHQKECESERADQGGHPDPGSQQKGRQPYRNPVGFSSLTASPRLAEIRPVIIAARPSTGRPFVLSRHVAVMQPPYYLFLGNVVMQLVNRLIAPETELPSTNRNGNRQILNGRSLTIR